MDNWLDITGLLALFVLVLLGGRADANLPSGGQTAPKIRYTIIVFATTGMFIGLLYGGLAAYAGEARTAIACLAVVFQSWLLLTMARLCGAKNG